MLVKRELNVKISELFAIVHNLKMSLSLDIGKLYPRGIKKNCKLDYLFSVVSE